MKSYKEYREYAAKLMEKKGIVIEQKSDDNIISFTPYISNDCSAACEFCSEQLVRNGKRMLCGEVARDYNEKLRHAFKLLKGKKVFVSLSGKEPTESCDLLDDILCSVLEFENEGGEVVGKVMYSNLSGFCKKGEAISDMLKKAKITGVECSRHHYLEDINQSIVHFKKNEEIKSNDVFEQVVSQVMEICPVKLVCVLQNKGIANVLDIVKYLAFAIKLGVKKVVFRELAMFNDSVENGKVAQYIEENRVELMDILDKLDEKDFEIKNIKQGYYYFSFIYEYQGMEVAFEMSDYEEMIRKHNGDDLYKLILYPNGKLCTDWNMNGEFDLEELVSISTKLCENANATIIGSLALFLRYPKALNRFPKDADLFAEGTRENLMKIIGILVDNGYLVKSWQDTIDEDFNYEMLKGRYYIRGTKGCNIVDVTYEIEGIEYADMRKHEICYDGMRFYRKEGMLVIMDKCDREEVTHRKNIIKKSY